MVRKITHRRLKRLYVRSVFFLTILFGVLIISSSSRAGVVEGKVTSLQGNLIELNLGSEKGVRLGDSGRIYYKITIGEKERQIFIAKFKISYLSEKSSMAQVEEKTGEIKVGFLVEVAIRGGELEVKSEPSKAKVYVDGKEAGESPLLLSDVTPGRHSIRVVKEGYEPFEIFDIVGTGRKEVIAKLKKVVKEGELVIHTEPPGTSIFINGRPVGKSPYEGKGLSPGIYRIRITKDGYESWEKAEIVDAGKRVEVLAQLKAKEGDLEVRSEPPGGKVYLDGKYMGETPFHLPRIRLGQYLVLVVKEGYYPYEERIEIKGADRKTVIASMKRRMGELVIRLKTLGGSLSIDGKPVELGLSSSLEKEFSPGSYRIKVAKEGYETWDGDVVVKAGERVEVSVELKMKKGELLVRTDPSIATIYLEGKSVGTGSYEGKGLSPGSYKLRVIKEGYETWEGDVVVEPGKQAEVFSKLKEVDWAQRSCDVPVWSIGDSWTYRDATGKFLTNQVFEIKEDLFIVRMEGDRDLYAYDRKTMNCNFFFDRTGRKVKNTSPFKGIFDFPLYVGKKWNDSAVLSGLGANPSNPGAPMDCNVAIKCRIEGVEEVKISAGTFKAYKIYYEQTNLCSMTTGWIRYWYSPAVKWWIKREVEKSPMWARDYRLQNSELFYYRLK